MSAVQRFEFAGGEAVVFSSRCPCHSTTNEDAAALIELDADFGVLVVADGMGGQPAGCQASGLALEQLGRHIKQVVQSGGELRAGILDGIEAGNQAILSLKIGAATTLAVVEIQGPTIRPYHVGDSPIMVVGQRGKVKLQTICHSPVSYAVESGLLEETDAIHHEDRHIVSNMIGSPEMRIEVGSFLKLDPLDTVLLASDGLFDNLYQDEIVESIRKGRMSKVARQLADSCRIRMTESKKGQPSKPDDLTFILFRSLGK